MVYFSFGIPKSGSTLAFELTKGLLEALGHPQESLSLTCFDHHSTNFLNKKWTKAFDESWHREIEEAAGQGKVVVIKTHTRPNDYIISQLRAGNMMAQACYRDPRDNILSLIDASIRSRARGRGAFGNIGSTAEAADRLKKQFREFESWIGQPGVLPCPYSTVAFESNAFLKQVGAQLGYTPEQLPPLNHIVERVKKKAFTQLNKGIPKRHRQELSVEQVIYLTSFFSQELNQHFSGLLDQIDQAMLSGADSWSRPEKWSDQLFKSLDFRIPAKPMPKAASEKETTVHHSPKEPAMYRQIPIRKWMVQLRVRGSNWFWYLKSWIHRLVQTRKTQRTYVVLGCPRGGTSLLAGCLQRAGIYMGEGKTAQYEDPDFKIKPKDKHLAVRKLMPVIQQRNQTHTYWGWKLPNSIYYIRAIRHMLIRPFYLIVYRNPEDIARSSAHHDGRNWVKERERLLEVAHNHTARVKRFQKELKKDYQVFHLEDIHADPETFVDQLLDILNPLTPNRDELLHFIQPSGGYVDETGKNFQAYRP